MRLNERQKAFCEHYAACFNATEAAVKAGYSKKTAYSIGQRLLKNVEIQNYLQTLTEAAKTGRIATIDEVLTYLSDTMRNEEEQTKERTKAAELLGKRYGMFIERREIGGDISISNPMQGLSEKELRALAESNDTTATDDSG